jgi:SET domain-containing protein
VKNRLLPPAALWVDERLVVRESPIEGRGLFFTDTLPAGTVVIRLGGRLVSSAELGALIRDADADPAASYVDTITVYDDAHLVLSPSTSIHFGNHSCDPTLWHVGPFEIATRRNVAASDEATIDYGTVSGAEGFRMACHCGAATCRGEVSSADWRRLELQERYRGHWVPALQERIDGK